MAAKRRPRATPDTPKRTPVESPVDGGKRYLPPEEDVEFRAWKSQWSEQAHELGRTLSRMILAIGKEPHGGNPRDSQIDKELRDKLEAIRTKNLLVAGMADEAGRQLVDRASDDPERVAFLVTIIAKEMLEVGIEFGMYSAMLFYRGLLPDYVLTNADRQRGQGKGRSAKKSLHGWSIIERRRWVRNLWIQGKTKYAIARAIAGIFDPPRQKDEEGKPFGEPMITGHQWVEHRKRYEEFVRKDLIYMRERPKEYGDIDRLREMCPSIEVRGEPDEESQ